MNDVHSEQFESKLDPYFTANVPEDSKGMFQRLNVNEIRSALATKRPLKPRLTFANRGIIGVSSPVKKI